MYREMTAEEILYRFDVKEIDLSMKRSYMPEFEEVYEKIKTALEIDNIGYNLYLIDDFSKDKLKNLIDYVDEILKNKNKPKDICYIIQESNKNPKPMFLTNGRGTLLSKRVEELQDEYMDLIFEFYNGSISEEKENLLDYISRRRSELLGDLIDEAKEEGFDIRSSATGFSFIPLKENRVMTEEEYDELGQNEKENILSKVNELKGKTKNILETLKEIEIKEIDKIKILMKDYFEEKISGLIEKILPDFEGDTEAVDYIKFISKSIEEGLIENYTSNYEDDEDKISEIIYKYKINVIVDNSENQYPKVIFEEDPTLNKLVGNIEYENVNGAYTTDVTNIKAGSLLRANEGCLILRLNSLLSHPLAYYYLKKTILSEKVDFNYNKGYLDFLAPSSLKPEDIPIKEKIILIGDYESYEILYNYDEDFKKVFKLRTESNPFIDVDESSKESLIRNIMHLCKENKYKPLTNEAIKEVAKFLARKAENKKKFLFDSNELNNLLVLCDNMVRREERHSIDKEDIIKFAYTEETIEKEILKNYRDKKILLTVNGEAIGKINGLSVIDLGYTRFGKPIRITCSCYKGTGNIVDVQKESNLSGKIHSKSIGILTGYINGLLGGYTKPPIDFHLSFEQLYGLIDGDSASVAEVISMISALGKVPIRQNIAVTGSINQFGEVQPIGGVNDKIEGFFKTCKLLDKIEGKGVLIPYSNREDLVLNSEVEEEIRKGTFKIFTMESVEDAIQVLMSNQNNTVQSILQNLEKEVEKYADKKKKSKK